MEKKDILGGKKMSKDIEFLLKNTKYSHLVKRAIFNPVKEEVLVSIREYFFKSFLEIVESELYKPLVRFFSTKDEKYLPKMSIGNGSVDISNIIKDIKEFSYEISEDETADSQVPFKEFEFELTRINQILNQIHRSKKGSIGYIEVTKDIFKENISKSIDKRIKRNKKEYYDKCGFLKKEYGCDNFVATEVVKGAIFLEKTFDNKDSRGSFYDESELRNDDVYATIEINFNYYLKRLFSEIKLDVTSPTIFSKALKDIFIEMTGTIFHETYHFAQTYLKKYGIIFGYSKRPTSSKKDSPKSLDLIEKIDIKDEKSVNLKGIKETSRLNVKINKEAYYIFLKIKEDIKLNLSDPYEMSLPIVLKRKKEFDDQKEVVKNEEYYFDLSGQVEVDVGSRKTKVPYRAFLSDGQIFVHFGMVESHSGQFSIEGYGRDRVEHSKRPIEFFPNLISLISNILRGFVLQLSKYSGYPNIFFEESYFKLKNSFVRHIIGVSSDLDRYFPNLSQNKIERLEKYLEGFAVKTFPKYFENWFEPTDDTIVNQFWINPVTNNILNSVLYIDIENLDIWIGENYSKLPLNINFFKNLIGNLEFTLYDLEYDKADISKKNFYLKYKNISKFIEEYGTNITKSIILRKINDSYKNEVGDDRFLKNPNYIIENLENDSPLSINKEEYKKINKVLTESAYEVDRQNIFEVIKEIKPHQFFEFKLDEKYNKRFPKLTILMLKNISKDHFMRLGLNDKYSVKNIENTFGEEYIDDMIKIVINKSNPKEKRRSRIFKNWNK
ncbi:hypothetical protein N9W84_00755 [bacterium]|nr:hypothetical protein [bacterium]